FTLSELEKETGLSRGIVHKEIKRLVGEKIVVEAESKGKLKVYRINVNHNHSKTLFSLFSTEKLIDRRNVVILAVWNMLESVVSAIVDKKFGKDSNVLMIKLFGSHARGTAAITSDIDVLIVVLGKNPDEEARMLALCEKYGKKLRTKINPVFMTSNTYEAEMKKKTAFADQISRGSIDVYARAKQEEAARE
ncbi:MAG: nucleotidyltransferase domain-containing protein, partial [Nanoarchaeota archaeon]